MSHVDNCNIKIEADHVCDYITVNALRREKLYLALVSCKILFQRLVVFNMTLFKGRHFKLSIHIFIISVRQVFAEIVVVLFLKIIETAMAESAPCLFYLFHKSNFFCHYYEKQTLYSFKQYVILICMIKNGRLLLVLFVVIKKKCVRPHQCGL